MKHPQDLQIKGTKVILVPYCPSHVPKYHDWMGDPEILRLTGSDRLSLEEEFKMQISWENDVDKCTFIILDRLKFEETNDEILSMVGDTNIFFSVENNPGVGEIEVMIGEEDARRKGMATEALELMLIYGRTNLQIKSFIAKIKDDNDKSQKLFAKLGFNESSRSKVFQEITFELNDNDKS